MKDYLQVQDGKIVSYVGESATKAFQAIAIAHALKFYAKTGMKVNRAYTPTAMLKTASQLTGKTYKRNAYIEAANDLQSLADGIKASLPIVESK